MLCAISGEAPQVPVVSRKSGQLFEKRLIEAHIIEQHTDPVTGEDLEADDLIELKPARTLRPRPPTLTSIPALLSAFQNEWDAIALETYNLRKELAQTRQELSTALYQHDAASRVIARLVQERDEARDALSKVTVSAGGGGGANGDAMQVDSQALPEGLAAVVTSTQERLSSSRKKRPAPDGWASDDDVASFDAVASTASLYSNSQALAIESTGDLVIVGGDGAGVYSISGKKIVSAFDGGGGRVVTATWWGGRAVVGYSNGAVKVFENGAELSRLGSHAGATTSLALHPSDKILASTGIDKSIIFYDLETLAVVSQIYTNSEITFGEFHPDGHLFAVGGQDAQIKLYDVASGALAAEFAAEGPVQALSFSENGFWLAAASKGQTSVAIWDLRKMNQVKTIDVGGAVEAIKWDYTGQFLAIAGPGCVVVQHYTKAGKTWSEPFRKATPAKRLQWGPNGRSLVALTMDDKLSVFGA